MIRENPIADQPQTFSAVDETNFAIKQILGFIVGYYGSVLEVTGNTTDAYARTLSYAYEGIGQVAGMHPEWGTSISLIPPLQLGTYWYSNESYSSGQMTVTYNLTRLGISGITYKPTCKLGVQVIRNATGNQARLNVTEDDSGPSLSLRSQNFMFFNYTTESTWVRINPGAEPAFENSTYSVDVPQGINPESYVIEVQDYRGIKVVASSINQYSLTPTWDPIYASTLNPTVVVELLQNGTAQCLGQPLQVAPGNRTLPIPPIPAKAFRVNQTINGVNQQVPFQMEDWGAGYQVPLALTSNASLFNSRNMIVFLMTPNVSKVTIWWNGSDQAAQTSFAIYNPNTSPFGKDNIANRFLSNGLLNVTISLPDSNGGITVNSQIGNMTSTAKLMRVNNKQDSYWGDVSWVIFNGIVRDIVQAEPEWPNDGAPGCPDFYAHIVITLPANATYFTYTSSMTFLNSTQSSRTLSDLCIVNVRNATKLTGVNALTENGTQASTNTALFYNYTGLAWAHHWSQIANTSGLNPTTGTGIIFNDYTNQRMYYFDTQTTKTGSLNVSSSGVIELDPVERYQSQDFHAQQLYLTWTCAIVTFDKTTPIYKEVSGVKSGLWITVEYPPVVAISGEH
jgi:hypothetical protein